MAANTRLLRIYPSEETPPPTSSPRRTSSLSSSPLQPILARLRGSHERLQVLRDELLRSESLRKLETRPTRSMTSLESLRTASAGTHHEPPTLTLQAEGERA